MLQGVRVSIKFGEWISVNDALPIVNKAILALVYDGYKNIINQAIRANDSIKHECRWKIYYPVEYCHFTTKILHKDAMITHWMSLPEPPKESI